MKPEFVTFTGIDDRTDLELVDSISQKYPVEWGVLFCEKSSDARYPSTQTMEEFVSKVKHGKKSAHLCGKQFVQRILSLEEELPILHQFDRVQLNGYRIDVGLIPAFSDKYCVEVIIQHRGLEFPEKEDSYKRLFDKSGGQGHLPEEIPMLVKDKLVGLAGGIRPSTVEQYMSMIKGEGTFWLDMETGVRTDGWLDLALVKDVLSQIYD